MNTNFNDLRNNNTLAPLVENKQLKEFYTPINMDQKDASILASISKSSVSAIEGAIGTLTHLVQNLKVYKECVIDSINLQAESTDISTKYARDIPSQSHTLPGIVSFPEPYNLNEIKSDNERMMQIKDGRDKAIKQKDIYLRIAQEDVRLFLGNWKRLNLANSSFDEFIESVNSQINDNY
jgi:hypothetical protein